VFSNWGGTGFQPVKSGILPDFGRTKIPAKIEKTAGGPALPSSHPASYPKNGF
jgi:hypothetical protein